MPATAAREALSTPGLPPLVYLKALDALLEGQPWQVYEPETLWIETQSRGVDLPTTVRNTLLAALTTLLQDSYAHDALVFARVALAFSGQPVDARVVEPCTPEELTYAVTHVQDIRQAYSRDAPALDHEPLAYAACVLATHAFYVPPPALAACTPLLVRLRPARPVPEWVSAAIPQIQQLYATGGASESFEAGGFESSADSAQDVEILRHTRVAIVLQERRAVQALWLGRFTAQKIQPPAGL